MHVVVLAQLVPHHLLQSRELLTVARELLSDFLLKHFNSLSNYSTCTCMSMYKYRTLTLPVNSILIGASAVAFSLSERYI